MTTEEKARAYDEALERAKNALRTDLHESGVRAIQRIFPQLAESEDERVRMALIKLMTVAGENYVMSATGFEKEQLIAYLEKQKESPKSTDSIPTDCTLDAKCEDRWHKVEDSLPDNGREVLAKDTLGNLLLARYDGEGWDVSVYDDEDYRCHNGVSKWCEIPPEKQKEQKPITQDVELNDAVYDYVRDHFIAGADFTPEYIKKLMENAFFAGVDYYLLKQESESCELDTNVEKVIEDVIRVYGKTQGEWVGGYDVDTLIVNLRRAFNKQEQKPSSKFRPNDWVVYDGPLGHAIMQVKDVVGGRYTFVDNDSTLLEEDSDEYLRPLTPKDVEKLAEWSEEDADMLNCCISSIEEAKENRYAYKETDGDTSYDREIAWLKSLRPSWKPSEDEERLINTSISFLKDFADKGYENAVECIDWLKSKLNGNTCE